MQYTGLEDKNGKPGVFTTKMSNIQIDHRAPINPAVQLAKSAAGLVDLADRHGDWKVVGESVLIDRFAHSAERDRLRVDAWIDHRREVQMPASLIASDRTADPA